jgi:ATP-binding cassette subfamily B protein/subfamily B ATP-binding cassette protein MsbA
MKHFLRVLRFAWPYRYRLLASILCAAAVALFWGANFTAAYPILKILGKDQQNLQTWINERIATTEKQIDLLQKDVDAAEKGKQDLEKEIDRIKREAPPEAPATKKALTIKEREATHFIRVLDRQESNLSAARSQLRWYVAGKWYIDRVFPEDRFQTMVFLLGMVVAGVAVKGFFDFGQEYLVGSVVTLSLFDLRNRFFRNIIHLDTQQFTDEGTSQLLARFTNDMESLGSALKTLFGRVIAEPLKMLSCIVFACCISWRLTLLFLVLVPVAGIFMSKVGTYMKRASRRVLESMSSLYKILQETFLGIRIVKAFTMERYERRRFFLGAKDYYRKGMCVVRLDAMSDPIMELLAVAAMAVALLVGTYLVLTEETHLFGLRMTNGPLEAESLLQLYVYLAAIADPVRKLSNVYNRIQGGSAACERIFAFLDRRPTIKANPNGPRLPRHTQGVEFRDLCFSYKPGRPILTNVQLEVAFGETIAIVGPNGSGKSTLIGLLTRFYDPDHGAILIDGVDIREVALRSLRQQIGLVSQDTVLFDDTIAHNIAYGCRHASPEQIEEAARKAYADDFITKLPQGYQTRIGEMGGTLSGGQRQRIALARAILRDPALLILDEATSAADLESEALIHQALREFVKNRTTFLITHRLSTLEIVNRIVVVAGGRIEAVGTHQELIRSCGTYQRLHEAQFFRQAA